MERYFKRKASSSENSIDTKESACGTGVNRIRQSSNAQPEPDKLDYRTRIGEFVECIRLILQQGFPLCGLQFEAERREGDFVGLVELLDKFRHPNGVMPQNAIEGLPMASGGILESLVSTAAIETSKAIIEDHGEDLFGIYYAGFHDVKRNHAIAVVLRYVDKEGIVKERFLGIVEVMEFSVSSLKELLELFHSGHGLILSRICGQCFDARNDVCYDVSGLKDAIIGEHSSAYYTHCFNKQLHSTLIAAAGKHIETSCCGQIIADILRLVGVRCEEHEGRGKKEKEASRIVQALTNRQPGAEELHNMCSRIGNTHWGFNYEMFLRFVAEFSSVIQVLDFVENRAVYPDNAAKARSLLRLLESFDFAFGLHLMKYVLGITNELSLALEKKDSDVAIAMAHVQVCKWRLQILREEGWKTFLSEVSSFCHNYTYVSVPNMDEAVYFKRSPTFTNIHHYRDSLFYGVIDSQLKVLDNLFGEATTELLLSASYLSPTNSFHAFDMLKLVKLAQFYPNEFNSSDWLALEYQLDNYILDVRSNQRFRELNTFGDLSRLLDETKKHIVYPLVYLFLKIVLLLPITAPTEERSVSAMKLVETKLRDQICDSFMDDCLVTYLETEAFDSITNDAIISCYESD